MIIDAKYKLKYQSTPVEFDKYLIEDIRQLSGYARDNKIISFLLDDKPSIIDCLIIYPSTEFLKPKEEPSISIESKVVISQFSHFFKAAVKLPVIASSNKGA